MSLNAISNIFHRASPDRARSSTVFSNLSSDPLFALKHSTKHSGIWEHQRGSLQKRSQMTMSTNPTVLLGY